MASGVGVEMSRTVSSDQPWPMSLEIIVYNIDSSHKSLHNKLRFPGYFEMKSITLVGNFWAAPHTNIYFVKHGFVGFHSFTVYLHTVKQNFLFIKKD